MEQCKTQHSPFSAQASRSCTKNLWFHRFASISPVLALAITTLLLYASLSAPVFNILTENQQSVLSVLSGYRAQHILILSVICSGVFAMVLGCWLCIKYGEVSTTMLRLMVRVFCAAILLFGVIGIRLPNFIAESSADLAQLQDGTTEETIVWLSPNTYRSALSEFIITQPVTRYGGIGDATDGKWEDFYFIDALGFSPAQNMLYNEIRSISWNEEHTQKYRIGYTSNLRLVVSIVPVA